MVDPSTPPAEGKSVALSASEIGRKSNQALQRHWTFFAGLALIIGVVLGAGLALVQPIRELAARLTRVDEEAASARTLAAVNQRVQRQTLELVQASLVATSPVLEPEDGGISQLRGVACEDGPETLCAIRFRLDMEVVQLPEECERIQARVNLLHSLPGAHPTAWAAVETWVLSDVLAMLPPDQEKHIRGEVYLPTVRPVEVQKDDAVSVWLYMPRCGAVSQVADMVERLGG